MCSSDRFAGAKAWAGLYLRSLGWIIVGGSLSALFCVGPLSMIYFIFSIPIGAVAGAAIGVPGAAVLTLWIDRRQSPPPDPQSFVMTLETIGAGGALLGCTGVVWLWWLPSLLSGADLSLRTVRAAAFCIVFVIVPVASSGRWVGRRLAVGHLRRWGRTVPPSIFSRPVQWHRGQWHPTLGRSDDRVESGR